MGSIKIISSEIENKAGDDSISDYSIQSEKIGLYPLYLQYKSTRRDSKGCSWALLQIQLKPKPQRSCHDSHPAASLLHPALCNQVGGCITSLQPPPHTLVLEAGAIGAGSKPKAPNACSLGAR